MIRHVVMFTFNPEVDAQIRMEFVELLLKLRDEIDFIRALEIGQNVTQSPRAADLVLMVDVDDEAALAEYADHLGHQPVKQMAAAVCRESRVVDYVLARPGRP
jgi:hypothetical protein